jgi:hypothetical protein
VQQKLQAVGAMLSMVRKLSFSYQTDGAIKLRRQGSPCSALLTFAREYGFVMPVPGHHRCSS